MTAADATAAAVVQISLSSTNEDFILCIVEVFARGVRFISSNTSMYLLREILRTDR